MSHVHIESDMTDSRLLAARPRRGSDGEQLDTAPAALLLRLDTTRPTSR